MMKDGYLARTLRETRTLKAKSQEYMALELGIARKTIQNWEKGASTPTIAQVMEWFRVLEISPLPYLFQFVHPKLEGMNSKMDEATLRDALLTLLAELPTEGVRQLLYLFYGDHGSSPRAVLNLVNAHLQTPMHDRVTAAKVILNNYESAKERDVLTGADHVQPDVELLKQCIEKAKGAEREGVDTYI